MIKIILGNVGSGKTAFAVREMCLNQNRRKTYSNIKTNLPNQINITPEMIITKEIVDYKRNKRTGENEPVYNFKLNMDYWQKLKNVPLNVILDEAHLIINARRSMSKVNIIVGDWMALIRRVLGQAESGYGELVLISQLPRRLDVIAKDMATCIIYTKCHYLKSCKKCGVTWRENSEMPESINECPNCNAWQIKKYNHSLEVWHFKNMLNFQMWNDFQQKNYYKHYVITDIEDYFKHYDTMSWDNLFSAYY